jgi:hypothetical protein
MDSLHTKVIYALRVKWWRGAELGRRQVLAPSYPLQ